MNDVNGARRAGVLTAAVATATLLAGCGTLQDLGPSAAREGPAPTTSATAVAGGGTSTAATGDASSAGPGATSSPGAAPTWSSPTTPQSTTPTPSPTATKEPAPSPTPTPAETKKPAPSPKPTPKPRTSLVRGDRGEKVLELQERLSELGYWLGTPDGRFGSLTQQAVWALQKSAGLSRDGVVGPRTTRALADGVRPKPTLKGDGVEIDLDRQVLLVVRGGTVRTVLNTSTGNGEKYTSTQGNPATAITPKGRFEVYRGVDGPLTNSLGELWRPRFFHRGFAVHGSPSIPPWPASHGCARLSNAAIDMIWSKDLMPIGATVVVR